MLVTETTTEGETVRRPVDLKLMRNNTALFLLSWTAMHPIDEDSPFHGPDAIERLRKMGAEIYLSLSATDDTIGQTIHARRRFSLDDIAWNHRFADILSMGPDGDERDHLHAPLPGEHVVDLVVVRDAAKPQRPRDGALVEDIDVEAHVEVVAVGDEVQVVVVALAEGVAERHHLHLVCALLSVALGERERLLLEEDSDGG